MLKSLFASTILAATLTTLSVQQTNAEGASALQRKEIETIIRSYLLENPELIEEVQMALETKRRAEAEVQAQESLKQNKELVFNSKHQGVIGNPDGDVTVVEFFDYNCGYCQRAMNDMNALIKEDPNVRFVLKELPILGEASATASQFSTAVYRLFPEKYGEFHNKLLGLQGRKNREEAAKIAKQMGLDVEALNKEADKADVIEAFQEANFLATELGMTGTPAYVIGDEVISGARGLDALRTRVNNMRKCGETTCS